MQRFIQDDSRKPDFWDEVVALVHQLDTAGQERMAADQVQNAVRFVEAGRSRIEVPDAVQRGYWNTISLAWDGAEVEIFGDSYELYDLRDQRCGVQCLAQHAGEPINEELLQAAEALLTRIG